MVVNGLLYASGFVRLPSDLVIGLGKFGLSICVELSNMVCDVLVVDIDLDKVNDYSDVITQTVQADLTDEKALLALGIRNFDHVIVAIGHDI
ncbi:MAG: TrkA family potassium uptake protein [Sporolactobacillus laevolacticus]|jgi:trk system potassium uptake protein TrkA|nr:TrkA family potassium uptake protein [Sporolactobacillus laevolacticus]